jgi:glycosyltransferase involved in cell wall biosynthesis
MTKRLAFVVTEDWAFWRHRLPMARAARDAGFEVHVITNVGQRAQAIVNEGFILHSVDMKRGSLAPLDMLQAIRAIRSALVEINPVLIHNVAIQPVVMGTLAAWKFESIAVVNSINGLGSAFMATSARGTVLRGLLRRTLHMLHRGRKTRIIVQNPEDLAALRAFGIEASQIVLVPGSGVECDVLTPIPEPNTASVNIAFVGRLLKDKGLRCLVRAHRLLRERGQTIELIIAGEPDPENPSSITMAEYAAWAHEPGITCLGHVEDIADVWRKAHIAVLPSRGEGLPKCLLEAAACGRPMIATNVPGCREIVIDGETGILVGVNDDVALADAIAELAHDADKRVRFGQAARALTVARFSAADIGRQTVTVYRELLDVLSRNARETSNASVEGKVT